MLYPVPDKICGHGQTHNKNISSIHTRLDEQASRTGASPHSICVLVAQYGVVLCLS